MVDAYMGFDIVLVVVLNVAKKTHYHTMLYDCLPL